MNGRVSTKKVNWRGRRAIRPHVEGSFRIWIRFFPILPSPEIARGKRERKKPGKNGKRRRKPLSYGTALASQSHFVSALLFLPCLSRQITQRPNPTRVAPMPGDARCQGIGERCGSNRPADWFDWFDWFANLGATQDRKNTNPQPITPNRPVHVGSTACAYSRLRSPLVGTHSRGDDASPAPPKAA